MVLMSERMFNEVCEENELLHERLQACGKKLASADEAMREAKALEARLAEAEECLRRCRAYGDGPAELVRIYFEPRPTSIRATMDGE